MIARPDTSKQRVKLQRATATIEIVMALGVALPFVGFLFFGGIRACRNLWHVIANTIGMPYL